MTTLYISGLFLSHLGNNVHLEAMQEQLGEQQKKASVPYIFSYTLTSRFIVSASEELEAHLPPVEGHAPHKEHTPFLFCLCRENLQTQQYRPPQRITYLGINSM